MKEFKPTEEQKKELDAIMEQLIPVLEKLDKEIEKQKEEKEEIKDNFESTEQRVHKEVEERIEKAQTKIKDLEELKDRFKARYKDQKHKVDTVSEILSIPTPDLIKEGLKDIEKITNKHLKMATEIQNQLIIQIAAMKEELRLLKQISKAMKEE